MYFRGLPQVLKIASEFPHLTSALAYAAYGVPSVIPSTTFSFMNFIVIEIYVVPRQSLELAFVLPNRQSFTSVDRLIHLDRIHIWTQFSCIARIHGPFFV